MIKIGITGGIGSGKSAASKILEENFNIPVFNADNEAKKLMNTNKLLQEKLGDVIINGEIDKKALQIIVFNDKLGAEIIAKIVHPFVHEAFEHWCTLQDKPIVAIEAAILFERGSYKNLDKTILITAPEEQRINRVMKRNNCSRQEVINRINAQWSDETKIKYCDYVVKNPDGDFRENMFHRLRVIHEQIKRNRYQKKD